MRKGMGTHVFVVPKARRASDTAAATNAPATTAPQDTPERFESSGNAISAEAVFTMRSNPSYIDLFPKEKRKPSTGFLWPDY
jgi:hypothetical protein